ARTSVSTGCYPSDSSHPNACGCNDRNPCTKFDRCQQDLSGNIFCAGDNLPDNTQCSAGTTCASAAVCESGVCTPTSMAPDGTPCDDHNVCTGTPQVPDACQSGKCVPGALNTDAPCDDRNECTTDDHCAMVAVSSTQFAKDSSGATRCHCCLPKGMNCIGGGTPCCSGTVGNVVMAGTCSTPTGPAGTGVVGVCQ